MRTMRNLLGWLVSSLVMWTALAGAARAGEVSGTVQSTRLYTAPDPSATGGIHARVVNPDQPILGVFAVPPDRPKRVYKATITTGHREFTFRGLPVDKYDLMVLFDSAFYEGFVLDENPDQLTREDRASIEKAILKAVPFFEVKKIHRWEGTTGETGSARCVLQEMRLKPTLTQMGTAMPDTQIRSIKLAFLECVGKVGWQLVDTREIVRQEVTGPMTKGPIAHHFCAKLSGIRVVDSVKDLGDLNLE